MRHRYWRLQRKNILMCFRETRLITFFWTPSSIVSIKVISSLDRFLASLHCWQYLLPRSDSSGWLHLPRHRDAKRSASAKFWVHQCLIFSFCCRRIFSSSYSLQTSLPFHLCGTF